MTSAATGVANSLANVIGLVKLKFGRRPKNFVAHILKC
jgi:hypothetical protein